MPRIRKRHLHKKLSERFTAVSGTGMQIQGFERTFKGVRLAIPTSLKASDQ